MRYRKLTAAVLAAAAGIAAEICRELHSFRMTEYKITHPKLAGLRGPVRLVFLSDLHNHRYRPDNEPLLQKIREADPHLVLIGGDMLVGKRKASCETALRFVQRITEFCPVYYANGNHEQRMKDRPQYYGDVYAAYRKKLQEAGVMFLENGSMELSLGSVCARLTGLELPQRFYAHFRKTDLTGDDLWACVGDADPEAYQILLAHNPAYTEEYLKWGADLILSGHMHGGIVRIPGLAGLISPSFRLFPKYSGGHYREQGTDIIVSRGLGVHTLPVRLFNPAEAVVLTLGGKE